MSTRGSYATLLSPEQIRAMEAALLRFRALPWGVDYDDLRQEAALAIWRARDVGDRSATLAYTITKRAVIDYLRRQTGRGDHSVKSVDPLPADFDESQVDETNDPVGLLAVKQAVARLAAFPERTRRMIEDIVAGDMQQDVAARMGVTPARVSQILGRVRETLQA